MRHPTHGSAQLYIPPMVTYPKTDRVVYGMERKSEKGIIFIVNKSVFVYTHSCTIEFHSYSVPFVCRYNNLLEGTPVDIFCTISFALLWDSVIFHPHAN